MRPPLRIFRTGREQLKGLKEIESIEDLKCMRLIGGKEYGKGNTKEAHARVWVGCDRKSNSRIIVQEKREEKRKM